MNTKEELGHEICRESDVSVSPFMTVDIAKIRKPLMLSREKWRVFFHTVRDSDVYVIFENDGEYVLAVQSGKKVHYRCYENIKLIPLDFFKKPDEDFFTVYYTDSGDRDVYLTNDLLLGENDVVYMGHNATSADIMPDGRYIAGYLNSGVEGMPTLTVSTENDERNDYSTASWYGEKSECVYIHADSKGGIWMNLADAENKLKVFRPNKPKPDSVKTEEEDFDSFGLSGDEKKLLVCHRKSTGSSELRLMVLADGWYHDTRSLKIMGVDEITNVSFFRNRASCISGDVIYVIDIDDI